MSLPHQMTFATRKVRVNVHLPIEFSRALERLGLVRIWVALFRLEALFAPWVGAVAVTELLPEAGSVLSEELDTA